MTPNSGARTRHRSSNEEALALWREYAATGDARVRNRLVMTYAPLVKYIVYKKVRELPAHCEVDDFISCGLEALISSLDRYHPDKGATLEQFVWTRIHGAVLDELRRQDWAPRSLRRWERDIARARDQFNSNMGRRPTREELAAALSISVGELQSKQDEILLSDVTSLNTPVSFDEETTVERADTLAAGDSFDPEHVAAVHEAKAKFRSAFETLPPREREVAVLLYVKNLTLREIGDILGVSESRVCQIHAQLKRTLKSRLAEEELLFSAVG
jgi:RNA polymerase sigma factor for flagellar operon FliA